MHERHSSDISPPLLSAHETPWHLLGGGEVERHLALLYGFDFNKTRCGFDMEREQVKVRKIDGEILITWKPGQISRKTLLDAIELAMCLRVSQEQLAEVARRYMCDGLE